MQTLHVTVSNTYKTPRTGFQAQIITSHSLMPYQDISTPLVYDVGTYTGRILIALNGPAHPQGTVKNLVHVIELERGIQKIDFLIEECINGDLLRQAPAKSVSTFIASDEPDIDTALALFQAPAKARVDSTGPLVECRQVRVQIVDSNGKGLEGYQGHLRFWGYAQLTKDKTIAKNGSTFHVPGGHGLMVCDVWKYDAQGNMIADSHLRARLNPGKGSDVSIVIVAQQAIPLGKQRFRRVIGPPGTFTYVDAKNVKHNSQPTHKYMFHEFSRRPKNENYQKSALALSLQRLSADHAKATIKASNPNAKDIRLVALISAEHGYFNLADAGGYAWTAYGWQEDGKHLNRFTHDLFVDELLVEWVE